MGFLHVSTDEVFGDLNLEEKAFSEITSYNPSSPYSTSKAASDFILKSWFRTYGLPRHYYKLFKQLWSCQNIEKFIHYSNNEINK